ncbi:multidrug and toxin extrusion protein 1-like [Asterias amurensis]|uniref:multidrug and toxin extrusion protein 1-like n=1 Tax=Asterias amurensis TaxID=7602 RepID=UPI003AB19BAB
MNENNGGGGKSAATDASNKEKTPRRCRDRKWCPSASLSDYKKSFKQLTILSWPVALYSVSGVIISMTSIAFTGHIGKDEIAASALAQSIIHVTWRSVMFGFTSAADTLFSQTYGSDNKKRVGIILQRFFVLTMLLSVVCSGVLINTEGLLLLVGQDPYIARLARPFGSIFILATPADAALALIIKYLESQSIVRPLVVIIILMSGINVLLHFILVSALSYGMIGAVIGQVISYYLGAFMSLFYIYWKKLHKETWPGWSWECLQEWGTVLRLGLPGVAVICVEWWTFETGYFLTGLLGKTEVGAHAILFSLGGVCWSVSAGFGVGTSILIGNNLGGNKPDRAKLFSACGLMLGTTASVVFIILYLSLQNVLGYIFTSDSDVIQLASSVVPIFAVFILFDSLNAVCHGVLRGCGYQKVSAIAVFTCFNLIAIPLGCTLTFAFDYGFKGIWLGLMTGLVVEAPFLLLFISFINWDKEAVKAQKRAAVLGDSDEKKALRGDEETPVELAPVNDSGIVDNTMQQVDKSTDMRSVDSAVDFKPVTNSEDVKTEERCLESSIAADDEEKESEPLQSDESSCVGEMADGEAGSSLGDVNALQDSSTAGCEEAGARNEDTQNEKGDVIEILTLDKLSLNQLILRRGLALFLCVSFFIICTLISVYIVPTLKPAISPNFANTTANYTSYDLLTESYQ